MGKKNLDVSAFMGSRAEEPDNSRINSEALQSKSSESEEKEELMITSFRLKKSFLKQMRIYALQKDLSTVLLLERAVKEYMQRNE